MKKGFGIAILFLCMLLLTGCWNRRELNEIALVVAMAIDKEDDQYLLTVQVVDPGEVASKQASSGRTPVTTYTEKGEYLFEAIRRMTTVTPRKLYFSHLQMFVISEEIAKDGLKHSLELLTRDPEFRKDFYIVVTKDVKAKEILENLTALEKIPANKMHSSLETSEKAWAPTVAIQMDELISSITSEGNNPVLTGITIDGDKSKGAMMGNVERISPYARLKYQNIAVFKKDKLVGWLNEEESKGYNYITGHVKNTVGSIPCVEKGKLVIEIIRTDIKVTGNVKNGKPSIDIRLDTEANIAEVACRIDLTDPKAIERIEKSANKTSEDILKSAVDKAKELNVDIFGFGEEIHREDPKAWKALKKDWNEEFENLPVTIHSNYKIRRTGTINKSFLEESEG